MKFRARKTFRIGPIFLTFTQRGFASWGFQWGRFRHNVTRGTTSVDTPGPGSVLFGGRKKGRG